MDEIDLWRSAALMVQQHGEDAAIQAAIRSDALLDQGDVEGSRVWRKIVGIINWLDVEKPDSGHYTERRRFGAMQSYDSERRAKARTDTGGQVVRALAIPNARPRGSIPQSVRLHCYNG